MTIPLSFTSPLGADKLQLIRVHGEEALGELFAFQLELSSADPALDFDAIVGKSGTVTITLSGGAKRYINGVVTRFTHSGGMPGGALYRAELRPWLWWLTLDTDARIYQQMSIPDIIAGLFTEMGYTAVRNELKATYTALDYCVQYQESSFDFVSRLMQDAGISYYFEHGDGLHTLVLLDAADSHQPCPNLASASYQWTGQARDRDDLVYRCEAEHNAVAGKFEADDYNYEQPSTALRTSATGAAAGKAMRVYEYPGGYASKADGDARAKLRMQALEHDRQRMHGDSTCRAFCAGYHFALKDHPRAELNTDHVLRRVAHSASQEQYSNSFEAFPLTQPFRPPRSTPRPRIPGSQSATVVGKAGEEIWTDSYGRIKVQFHWDQRGKNDEHSSCWIRVAQGWAGQGWGTFFLPRIGQEVIVSFLNGDPDRPLVTGSVYNAVQTVPDPLPAQQTRSTIRGNSSKGGGGNNEISFDDKKDAEELYLHAQKDMKVKVENDRTTTLVAGNDVLGVDKGTRAVTVAGDETHTNKANFTHKVAGNFALTVDGNLTIKVTGTVSIQGDSSVALQAGTSLASKAGTELTNNAGTALTNKAGTTLTNDAGISLVNKAAASQTVDGGGMLEMKGGIVKIN